MEVKRGYKQTEVGVIPEDWHLRPLLTVVRVASGQVDPRIEPYHSMTLVAPDHIESSSGRLLLKQTAGEQRAISGKYLFAPGDVVYSKIRPYLRKAILADFEGLCSADMYPLKPAAEVSAGFVFSALLGHHFSKYAESVSVRSGMPKINRAELAEYTMALPPTRAEQEAIADALSDADALIESLEQLIAKKSQIKQGAMQELLTGNRRLPGFTSKSGYKQTEVGMIPEDWNTVTLEYAAVPGGLVRGPFGGTLKKQFFVRDGYKVYEQRNAIYGTVDKGDYFISRTKFKELERFRVRPGDLIVSCSGTIGCIYRIPQEAPEGIINQALLKISLNEEKVNHGFFLAVFGSKQFQARIKENTHGGAMQNLVGMDVFMKTLFQIPPQKAEQEAIAAIIGDMDDEITTLGSKLNKARQIKQGMMQELLTGRIRLV